MKVNVIDVNSRRHIRLQSPPLEVFERMAPDGKTPILRLDRLEHWARAVNWKNPEFSILTILKGAVYAYYIRTEIDHDLVICWKKKKNIVKQTVDLTLAIEKIEEAVLKVVPVLG